MAQITIRTNITPTLTFDPSKKDGREWVSQILQLIQPSLDGQVPYIGPVHYAPYGEPKHFGAFLVAVIALLALYGGYKFVKGGK